MQDNSKDEDDDNNKDYDDANEEKHGKVNNNNYFFRVKYKLFKENIYVGGRNNNIKISLELLVLTTFQCKNYLFMYGIFLV